MWEMAHRFCNFAYGYLPSWQVNKAHQLLNSLGGGINVAKGSLLPENAVGGSGIIPDGDYNIKDIVAHLFDYGGRTEAVPAIAVTYVADDGTEYEQNYSAGKGSSLAQPEDGKRFEVIGRNSNASAWLGSIINGGFPAGKVDDDVTVFKGCRVTVTNTAQPKRPGLKDQAEGKTIPLVTKVLALPGAKGGVTRPTAAATQSKTAAPAATSTNGNVDDHAVEVIQAILATATDGSNSLTRLKLGTAVMLTLAKQKDPHMVAVKKLATDATWLAAQMERDPAPWVFDADTITLV
jgi:hypothetical protein